MTREEFADLLKTMQEEENTVRAQAQQEYAREDDNALANFERVGNMVKCKCEHCGRATRIGPMATLMVYFLKHTDGILAYIGGYTSQREDVRGRVKDGRLYLGLLRGLVEKAEATNIDDYDDD